MRLFIAEKPSLGRAIAQALPGSVQKHQGYLMSGASDCVTWCVGHLLEQAEPHHYDTAFKSWVLKDLPIVPKQWALVPKKETSAQLRVIKSLLKKATTIVHAGDPDREGQLLVDEVLHYLGVGQTCCKTVPILRCFISDLNPAAIQRALKQLRNNADQVPLSTSALARARADWLYGLNMTRAYTLQGQKAGYQGVLSVGRVQTPVLGLVVRRDREIESFVPKPFYQVEAHVVEHRSQVAVLAKGQQPSEDMSGAQKQTPDLMARWLPSEACKPHQDEQGRVLNRALAEHVMRRITEQPASVVSVVEKNKQTPPPLPFNLSALQVEAGTVYGMRAQQVLDACQQLYEQHKLITYPRSDCRYLPEGHFAQATQVVDAIGNHFKAYSAWVLAFGANATLRGLGGTPSSVAARLAETVLGVDVKRRSAAWNDKKVAAHHAIIPTARASGFDRLTLDERRIYELVARQYLLQFFGAYCYADTCGIIEISGGKFEAKAHRAIDVGWRAASRQNGPVEKFLPPLQKGQQLWCQQGVLVEKQTTPPPFFTDATLLLAMTGIARYVQDPQIRKILRETDGLGTEATRAGMIELLIRRDFLQRQGRQVRSTRAGAALVDALPAEATLPDMTAHWEAQLDAISRRITQYQDFMGPLVKSLQQMIVQAQSHLPEQSAALASLSGLGGGQQKRRRAGTTKFKTRGGARQKTGTRKNTVRKGGGGAPTGGRRVVKH
jgi:DNA topoisomerase-3